jgi:hypothetical protein
MARNGGPKTGGRVAGTKNKIKASVDEILAKYNFDPFEALVLLAKDGSTEKIRLDASKEAVKYCRPQLKAIEHSGPGGSAIQIELTDEVIAKACRLVALARK